ncbi:MAG TPA: hypothetical protein P5234_08390 [Thermoanaerobaculaceae bacterium]|nr:hypothetical protein [Thermoanaerobaculaceae bacterium]HRS16248.1 hypothetical protein [Thermoanaerobaculaceae bacterium]
MRLSRRQWMLGAGLLAAGAWLGWPPEPEPVTLVPAGGTPFEWRQDARWDALERRFVAAREAGCEAVAGAIEAGLQELRRELDDLSAAAAGPDASSWDEAERALFATAPLVAACPDALAELARLQGQLRDVAKRQSRSWDLASRTARDRLYRVLHGSRAALDEAILQAPGRLPEVLPGEDVPSRAPAAVVHGVRVHSGDLLLSRGTAPVSALIARGSDYPGSFSHVALVHVAPASGAVSVVEAHIERGVAVASAETYLADAKWRIVVLRPRPELPPVRRNPLLPHRAASLALAEAHARHIPYDFAMDAFDPARMFCSEVASWAYGLQGVRLWMGPSRISSPGLARWLGSFGVRHFESQQPSDLEADPQLAVVAEWRHPEGLWEDHLYSAVVEVMLEEAEGGAAVPMSRARLPLARLAKAWSWVLNRLGRVGPVPEGLSATAALRSSEVGRVHRQRVERLQASAEELARRQGYRPPYWQLVRLARADTSGATHLVR